LIVTLRRCAWSLQRERKLEQLGDDGFVANLASADALAAAATEQVASHDETALVRAFTRLPNNYRLVLLLAEVEESPVNVAPLSGCPPTLLPRWRTERGVVCASYMKKNWAGPSKPNEGEDHRERHEHRHVGQDRFLPD
jgi:hypothetical protein